MSENTHTIDLGAGASEHVHIIGIGGAGMSAIALVLMGLGHKVTGSDLADSKIVAQLRAAGAGVEVGHSPDHLGEATYVTHSTAIKASNEELAAAVSQGLPVLKRSEMLAAITRRWSSLLVAGTHGKTTTSAMLSVLLDNLDLNPSFIVGGQIGQLGGGAAVGTGDYLVVESDESDGTFLELSAAGAIVTNVEPDHLEFYGNFENLERAFKDFVTNTNGPVVMCADDEGCQRLFSSLDAETQQRVTSYGFSQTADYKIGEVLASGGSSTFKLKHATSEYEVTLRQPGDHNALNAVAAGALAVEIGQDPQRVFSVLGDFQGVGRRYEVRGSVDEILFVDDYAHLPTEIEAALAAAKSTNPKRLVAVFQPHRYSRTEQLWKTFGSSFRDVDLLVVTGIYSSGESPRPGISGQLIADQINLDDPDRNVTYIESLVDVEKFLVESLRSGDLCMTLGAGDLTEICDPVMAQIEAS